MSQVFGEIFQTKDKIFKYYIAIVQGEVKYEEGLISQPLMWNKNKMKAVLANISQDDARNCNTHIKVVGKVYLDYEKDLKT